MTHVSTPQTGTVPRGGSRPRRSMVGALAVTVGIAAAIAGGFAVSQQNDAPASPPATSSELARQQAETARLQGMADAYVKQQAETQALEEAIAKGLVPEQTLVQPQSKSAQEAEALREAIEKNLVPEQTLSSSFVEKPGQPR